jgi:sugar/nucleoside kinase (ribokinase family)
MNFWIGSELESLKKVIARVKMVIINEGEARELTHDAALLTAARKIQSWGPEIVVIKRGEYGALLFFKEHVFSAPGLPLETVKDPTGAGDSFAGGVVGYLAMKNDFSLAVFKQSIIVGSTMASFNVEDFSCKRLQALTKKEISDRIRLFKELSHFEEVKI